MFVFFALDQDEFFAAMHPCPISQLVPNCPLLPRQMRGLAGPLLSAPVECASAAWLKKDGCTAEAGTPKRPAERQLNVKR